MTTARDERIGSISMVLGATLLAVYADLGAAARPDHRGSSGFGLPASRPRHPHRSAGAVFRVVLLAATVLGALSFGVAVYRSDKFPKAAVLLPVAGAAIYAVGPMISILMAIAGVILFAIGGILIGARLWRVENV